MPSRYGHRVLVVDDSPTNLLVATAMLKDRGLDVDTAVSVAQAVACAGKADYALILMDLSLPDGSGLDAAREIRGLGGHNREMPIVAVTGQSSRRERDECLAAGMNDFISKPIDLRILGSVLRRWCGVPLFAEPPRAAVPLPAGRGIDGEVFAGLRADLTPASLLILVSGFCGEAEASAARLRAAAAQRDYRALGDEAHRLKSSAALFGATDLVRALSTLASAVEDGGELGAAVETVAACAAEAAAWLRTAIA